MRRTGYADDQGRGVAPNPDDPDGRPWRLGTAATVRRITEAIVADGTITTVLPAVFPVYAMFEKTDPDDPLDPERHIVEHERAVVSDLRRSGPTRWWLGYLDTGAHDVVFPEAPRVSMYFEWDYLA